MMPNMVMPTAGLTDLYLYLTDVVDESGSDDAIYLLYSCFIHAGDILCASALCLRLRTLTERRSMRASISPTSPIQLLPVEPPKPLLLHMPGTAVSPVYE